MVVSGADMDFPNDEADRGMAASYKVLRAFSCSDLRQILTAGLSDRLARPSAIDLPS